MRTHPKTQYFVVGKTGYIYHASNAGSAKDARCRHEHDLGKRWRDCVAEGDRLVRLRLTPINSPKA